MAIECHRRYFLQQACEKGTKALGLILWRGSDTTSFNHYFLYRHDPLTRLKQQPDLPRALRLLLITVQAEFQGIDNAGLLFRVDGTSPSTNPMAVSYRYPFVDTATGARVAPVDWRTSDWDAYQGNEVGVIRAVKKLLDTVERRAKRDRPPI
jgi:hypothetical protein